ncbi:MAG TPA: DUF2167 domain-containing protein [Gemmatimonadaceae bacterium]|nr:DUF2167 domain-containing protein [Gemmatimonadaceae bacterium]
MLATFAALFISAAATPDSVGTDSIRAMESRLAWQQGRVEIRDGLATLDIPAGFRYLDADAARTVLVDLWGNPPQGAGETLGMIFPADVGPTDDGSWGVVITYDEDGYVKDDEAAKMDYAKLLAEMQADTRDESEARERAGYGTMRLVGWAQPPRYDAAAHKLYWAKELDFGDGDEHTLNYNVRVLGRRGVLVLNAVSGMGDLPHVERGMADVMTFVNFNDGHRYADFDPRVDRVAAYGIAALVAGKVAAKAGFFKVLLTALVAAKKLVLVALLGIIAIAKRLFGRKAETAAQAG